MQGGSEHHVLRAVSGGQGLLLEEAEALVAQDGQKRFIGDARELAAVAAGAKPAALVGAQIQVARELGHVAAVVHGDAPALLVRDAHEAKRQLVAPDGGEVALARHDHRLALVVGQIVGVQVQLRAVDEVEPCGENRLLLAQEGLKELRGHRRLDAHARDEALRRADVLDHAV